MTEPGTELALPEGGLIVAIDGPAGAGKSTASRRLAARLGYTLLDTGAIYRSVALLAHRRGLDWADEAKVAGLASQLDIRFAPLPDPAGGPPGELTAGQGPVPPHGTPSGRGPAHAPGSELEPRVFLGDEEVTRAIREPEISRGSSIVSALPAVRAALLELQRRLGRRGGVVVEGRDVGTVVFPDAQAKFFLTADPKERARRRAEGSRQAGREVSVEGTLEEMARRDHHDTTRTSAPLKQAGDAVVIDSSGLTLDEVVDRMEAVVRQRWPRR